MKKLFFSFVLLTLWGCTLRPFDQDQEISCQNINKYLKIVYEDNDLVVINKSIDRPCVAKNQDDTKSILDLLHIQSVCSAGDAELKAYYVVHDLGRDTQGLVVFAKNERAQQALQSQFDADRVEQGYRTVVEGVMEQNNGSVSFGKAEKEGIYTVLRKLPKATYIDIKVQGVSAVELTKRLALLGHPVFGDRLHGATYSRNFSENYVLQAYYIRFQRPFTNEFLELTLSPSDYILEAIDFTEKPKK